MIESAHGTIIVPEDEKQFNANHQYRITTDFPVPDKPSWNHVIKFQKGPVKENGMNGIQNEDLLHIVAHRLQCFQDSEYSCRENALALTKIQESLMWLNKRTQDRINRGVEGTHTI